MTELGDVFGSLRSMDQRQLLLAFVACIAYAIAQGRLLARPGQRIAWLTAACAAAGFASRSDDWAHATVLVGFAIAGMGSFVAVVWVTSRALGFQRTSSEIEIENMTATDGADSGPSTSSPPDARPCAPLPGGHAHSL